MRTRLWSTTAAALAAMAMLAVVPSGCTHRNPDLDRVVDPYWKKSDFVGDNATWYYRTTVIDTAPGGGHFTGTIADGDWLLLERLRWEVTEKALIGYRDYASAPGTENDLWAGSNDVYDGSPVAVFAITSHFDVRRNYDSMTGEESNVIVENTERPWYDREYFRVDWSANLVPTYRFHITLEQLMDSYYVLDNDPGDPKRMRFERNEDGVLEYFEVTTRSDVLPDLYSFYGLNGPGYMYDNASVVVDLRHSFVRASEKDLVDFESVPMPPSVVLTDEDGNEVRGADGIAERVSIWDRFGIYSTGGRNFWDPNRGITDSGRQFHATIFDIWEKTYDNGQLIPVERRTPKPIVYYTNVTHPKQLLRASIERVGGEWNRAFKEAVFHAQTVGVPESERPYGAVDDVPDMFVVRENSCNPANVKSVLDGVPSYIRTRVTLDAQKPELGQNGEMLFDGTIESVLARYEQANAEDNDAPFTVRQAMETQALEDLERICSALEFHTDRNITRDESITPFKYQRFGDVRYNMMNLIMSDHNNAWLGYGPMLGDPVTGRTVQATANIAVSHLDTAVERYTEMVDVMNGLVSPGDLVSGLDVQAYMTDKLAYGQQLTSFTPSEELRARMSSRLAGLGPSHEALHEISPTYVRDRLSRIAGTPYESLLVTPEDAILFGVADPASVMMGDVSVDEHLLEELSPARGLLDKKWQARESFIQELGKRAMDTVEFVDRFGWSVALRLKDEPDRRKRFEKIREELYVAVQLHEVGHNVGLYHNFEASTDALNYGERFWRLQSYPEDPVDALSDNRIPDEERALIDACITEQQNLNARLQAQGYTSQVRFTTQECLGQQESMYSSIMDYHGTWNGDFGGLGPYDKAAIKFAYGKVLEVFPEDKLAVDASSTDLKRWTYYNDWRRIPDSFVTSVEAVNDRDHVKYEWNAASTTVPPPENAVPYRFCPGGTFGNTPWCQTGDFGPDMKSNAALNLTRYYQYYFFTHFNRGRLWDYYTGVGMDRALLGDEAVLYDFTKKMQWYVFLSLTDPDFRGSYAEEDFLSTTIMGLNHFSAVIGQPASGQMISVPNYQVESLLELGPDDDRLAPSNIMTNWSWQGQCEAIALAEIDSAGNPIAAQPGYQLSFVKLGDGRPFFLGLTEDYEEYYIRHVGSYWAKWDALFYLGYNAAWFPRTTYDVDPRVFDISWYRLFPDIVGGVFKSLVTAHDHELGPVVDAQGRLHTRNLIDPATGRRAVYDPSEYKSVLPSIAYNHQYLGMLYAHALMSSRFDGETDFLKSFKVAIEGASDDFGAFDYVLDNLPPGADPADYVAEFTHPVSGRRARAINTGENPVAYKVVQRANVFRERYERLSACVADPDGLAKIDPYCSCVMVVERRPQGRFCTEPFLQPPGEGECAFYSLERRQDRARELLDDMADYIDDIRVFNTIYSEW